ncbi:uncharacterized protein LOC143298210 [Babylonia areolata]|uniref:uncharacterized protein LOC143298210 n=1 Tax=Babylonia areolata TaxID=304850 RepID=UPI003FCFDE5F
MSVFSSRSGGYKIGFLGIIFFTGLYIVGFGAPYWGEYKSYLLEGYSVGLWMGCLDSECESLGISNQPAWFHLVRAMECMGLVFLAFSCLYGLSANCREEPKPYSRAVESWASSGATIGLSGTIVFFVKNTDLMNFKWGVFVSTAASVLLFVCAIMVSANNRAPPAAATATATGTAAAAQSIPMGVVESGQQPATVQGVQYSAQYSSAYSSPSAAYGSPVYHVPLHQQQQAAGYPPMYSQQYPSAPPK